MQKKKKIINSAVNSQGYSHTAFSKHTEQHVFNMTQKPAACVYSKRAVFRHLPLLALGTVDVSGCVAPAREHTGAAGRTHTA